MPASPMSVMRHALLLPSLTGLVLLATGGCSAGSTEDQTSSVRIRCLGGQTFCIISCDLGCSQTGCSVSEISENQRLRFKFSDRIQPASVNSASISIRTASGVAPDGDFLVQDSEVTFVPKVRTVNGVSTFGFLRNESYIISLAGGATAAFGVRSLTGDRLSSEFSCTVVASRGVLDEDQAPPTAEMLAPTNLTSASRTPTIVLRFSELIDTTALQGQLGAGTPIRVTQRSTLSDGTCNLDAEGSALGGLPQIGTEFVNGKEVTVVSVQTPQLPSKSCITVYVTPNLRDLAGTPAVARQFQFITEQGPVVTQTIRETFSTGANQDVVASGGVWASGARPGLIGGDGRHGPFRPEFGTLISANVFEWNLTAGFTIPGSNTPDGNPVTVTDGRFFFSEFVVPEGTTVRFRGTVVPQIFVRGQIDIGGLLDLSGADLPGATGILPAHGGQKISSFNSRGVGTAVTPGQTGGVGGPGGGTGGKGGDECVGTVVATAASNGQPGEDVRLPAGHAYAGANVGTGGAGSPMHPANGLSASATSNPIGTPNPIYRSFFSPGGGGGGYSAPGGLPALPTIPTATLQPSNGPTGAASAAFSPLPFPAAPPAGYSSLDHFLIGGSGGGGGGSNPFGQFLAFTQAGQVFSAGHAGTGGGGAIALRAGGDVVVKPTGSIVARGGDGVLITSNNPTNDTVTPVPAGYDNEFGFSSPGGGGSGGSVLLQSARTITVSGAINARGGQGSRNGGNNPNQLFLNLASQAGNGSPGFYRLEAATAQFSGTGVPAFQSAQNTGPLLDVDSRTGSRSTWLLPATGSLPVYLRYELLALVQGQPVLFSDDPTVSPIAADDPAGPVQLRLQAGFFDSTTGQVGEASWGPWRKTAAVGADSINRDHGNAVRFDLTIDRTAGPVTVLDLRIVWR